MTVTVYSKPHCPQCEMTRRLLDRLGVAYQTVDVAQNQAALEYVRGLGYLQAPVVVAGDEHWSGYRPDRLKTLAAVKESA